MYEPVRDSVRAQDEAVDALVDVYSADEGPFRLLQELELLGEPGVPELCAAELAFAEPHRPVPGPVRAGRHLLVRGRALQQA